MPKVAPLAKLLMLPLHDLHHQGSCFLAGELKGSFFLGLVL